MEISIKQLKILLRTLAEGGASEFDYRDDKYRIRVALQPSGGRAPVAPRVEATAPGASSEISEPAPEAVDLGDRAGLFVTSPFVGTFFRAASPEGEPFVSEGSAVKPGQVLCIIEAMKLMNEIEAEVFGTIEEVLVENGKSVEFGQKLFKVRQA